MDQKATAAHSEMSWKQMATESITSAYEQSKEFASHHLIETSVGAAAAIGIGVAVASRGRLIGAVAKYFPDGTALLEEGAEKSLVSPIISSFSGGEKSIISGSASESLVVSKLKTPEVTPEFAKALKDYKKLEHPEAPYYAKQAELDRQKGLSEHLGLHQLSSGVEQRATVVSDEELVGKLPAANTLSDLNNLVAKYNTSGATLSKIPTTFGLDLELPEVHKIAELSEDAQLKVALMQSLKKQIAGHPNTPSETLYSLADDKSPDVKWTVADNANASPETMEKLASEPGNSLKSFVASREHTSAETLAKLANEPDALVRANVAANESTAPETIAKLSDDDHWLVQLFLSRRADASPELLAKLGAGADSKVNLNIAIHTNTAPETLAKLAHDEDWSVRAAVAENKKTPLETLSTLTNDRELDEVTRNKALDRYKDLIGRQ